MQFLKSTDTEAEAGCRSDLLYTALSAIDRELVPDNGEYSVSDVGTKEVPFHFGTSKFLKLKQGPLPLGHDQGSSLAMR